MKYNISVRTIQNTPLKFTNVTSYTIDEFGVVNFEDSMTGKQKKFHISNVEIEEVE